jgi:polyphosphate kinase
VAAAEAGKEITVLVELRARFDEASNIAFANRLQEVGAHVVHGVVGYKTHCKMALIVRREGGSLKRYAHLGTGNYHPGTARAYSDYGLLTADESLTEDVHHVFLQLTSMARTPRLIRLLQAPFELHRQLMMLIEQEITNVTSGGTGHVIAKVNALTEPEIIAALYRASCAGVMIDLVVRGICCLRPGLVGISENIRVRSIIGRFLEHSRVYYFHAGGKELVYCASADLMERNLFRRVEIAFPISEPEMRQRIVSDLDLYLQDNSGAWELRADGTWEKSKPKTGEDSVSAQQILLRKLAEAGN